MRHEVERLKDAGNGPGGRGLFGDMTRGLADVKAGAADLSAELGDGDNTDGTTRRVGLFRRAIGGLGDGLVKLGQMIDGGSVRGPLTFLRNALAIPFGSTGSLLSLSDAGPAIGGLGGAFTAAASAAAAFGVALLVIPTAAAVVQFVVSALTVVFTTFAAAVVAALGPLGVLVSVLGGVGLGAFLGFQRALQSSGPWAKGFREEIGKIKDGFGFLTKTLAADFLPWFDKVGKVALDVLGYFNHLAVVAGKSGLSGVFKSLADGGFARLNTDVLKVVGPIGNVLAAVIKFAFGTGGAEGEAILKADFSRFVTWAQTAFEPLVRWFDRQHFEKTGQRWARELLNSPLMQSIISHIGQFIVSTLGFAAQRAWDTFKRWAMLEFNAIIQYVPVIGAAIQLIEVYGSKVWGFFKSVGLGAWHAIAGAANVVLSVVDAISGAIQTAVGFAEQLASKLAAVSSASVGVSILGHGVSVGLGGVSAHASGSPNFGGWSLVGEAGPEFVRLPAGSQIMSTRRSAAAMAGGSGVTINIFGADLSTPEQQRRIGSQLASILGSNRVGGGF